MGRHTHAARAIKIIMKDKVPNEDRSRRLQREIQTLFALDHPPPGAVRPFGATMELE